jgi:hypothetical protein
MLLQVSVLWAAITRGQRSFSVEQQLTWLRVNRHVNIKGYELPRLTQARWTETLNLLQVRMVVTPLDLVAGKNRDYQFSFIVPLLMLLWQALWWSLSASWPTFRSDSVRDVQCEVVNHEWCSSTAGVRRWWRLRGVTHFWVSLLCPIYLSSGIHFLLCRARTEHRIFQKLLAMVPNLLDRVVESEAELVVVAESVSVYLFKIWPYLICCRSRKEFLVQDLTTLKVWKV